MLFWSIWGWQENRSKEEMDPLWSVPQAMSHQLMQCFRHNRAVVPVYSISICGKV